MPRRVSFELPPDASYEAPPFFNGKGICLHRTELTVVPGPGGQL